MEWITTRQQQYQVGALPVLYALLETLQVRHIINRHCPTKEEVAHGDVALVIILNRLMFSLPLYRVADWVSRTVLTGVLGIPAAKFNDDRLGCTLDALYPHLETIWLEIVEVAIYDQHNLRYLAGLRCTRKGHKALLTHCTTKQLETFPLEDGPTPQYWGRGCQVVFHHEGRSFTHQGLVILAGPIREQLRQTRREQLAALAQELSQLQARLGQPYYRTLKMVQRKANARCKASKVGHLMAVTVYETAAGVVNLHWQVDAAALHRAEEGDGRYLLVTNDWSLSHREMFRLYREKDGVEKRFTICKSDLKVSPVYLHQDKRIASMLLLNMVALLAYSLLERQARQTGLQTCTEHSECMTTRQIIRRLERLSLIETHCCCVPC